MTSESMTACLLGGALGDTLGLPFEGLSARRIARLTKGKPLRQRLLPGAGMVSDDTEHAVMTLLSLRESGNDPVKFGRLLARRLRWWFAGVPAGIGLATAKSIIRLWFGVNPARSGVYSAGNGPLMRAAVIGVQFAEDETSRNLFCDVSTRITHSDPRASECARIIAEAAAFSCSSQGDIQSRLTHLAESEEMRERFANLFDSLGKGSSVNEFADRISRRQGFVSGFAPDTAAVALYAWLRHRGDFRATLEAVIHAGGDTDTVAFVAGSLAGIDAGETGLPDEWLEGIRDWPISATSLKAVGHGVAFRCPAWPLSWLRNGFFLAVILLHAFRRMLPPY